MPTPSAHHRTTPAWAVGHIGPLPEDRRFLSETLYSTPEIHLAEPELKKERISYAEYLEMEAQFEERHIFWDGEVLAMAGASIRHSIIETNLVVALGTSLRGQPCRPFVGNQRLRALNSERAVYADALVVCGPPIPHPEDPQALTNPAVVFEVLSKSTEAFDRGDKFAYYRQFPGLNAVVLISQKALRVECYRRGENGVWSLTDLGPNDALHLPEMGVRLPIRELYENAG